MSALIEAIWRYPIKSHGRERLTHTELEAGSGIPWDRAWAVAHEKSRASNNAWAPCGNFGRVADVPKLAQITAILDAARAEITLRHPDRPDITVQPDQAGQALVDWVTPLTPPGQPKPARIIRVSGRGMTDSPFPSISLCNLASHRAVEDRVGHALSVHRWRGNIWFDGLSAWAEFDWIGRAIRVGGARCVVREAAARCPTIMANPETGNRDVDMLGALAHWGHSDFSVLAEVVESGPVAQGDVLELL
ncbi:MAG: MOSC N-terminal beta barrel domain-containing protein [Pseudomonadota bacterium]